MNKFQVSRFLAAALGFGVAAVQPANAQGAGPFAGKSINAVVNYQVKGRRGSIDFDAPMKMDLTLSVSADGTVRGNVARSSTGQRGPIATSRGISATIGKPREVAGSGNSVIIVSGNTLTILRTFEVGGVKITINLQGGGRCRISAPMAREVGAGNTKRDHIAGGTAEIFSARQVSSSCSAS